MNVVADENIARIIVDALRHGGHNVVRMNDIGRGTKDDMVLHLAANTNALLLTGDKDFGELVFRRRQITSGVILVRLEGITNPDKAKILSEVLQTRGEALIDAFTVITPRGVRVRRKPHQG